MRETTLRKCRAIEDHDTPRIAILIGIAPDATNGINLLNVYAGSRQAVSTFLEIRTLTKIMLYDEADVHMLVKISSAM